MLTSHLFVCVPWQGHSDTVEDVVFQPGSSTELASVADDSSLLFWDTRSGVAPVLRMGQAHGESDLHVVDWSALRPELVATGHSLQWHMRCCIIWCTAVCSCKVPVSEPLIFLRACPELCIFGNTPSTWLYSTHGPCHLLCHLVQCGFGCSGMITLEVACIDHGDYINCEAYKTRA